LLRAEHLEFWTPAVDRAVHDLHEDLAGYERRYYNSVYGSQSHVKRAAVTQEREPTPSGSKTRADGNSLEPWLSIPYHPAGSRLFRIF
jgi:hypothetical protein